MNIDQLEQLYDFYNQRQYVHPDPLEVLYDYHRIEDREIVGLIAAGLAYGRVAQILVSIRKALQIIGENPHEYIMRNTPERIRHDFSSFKHRFTTGCEMAELLIGMQAVLSEFGSLEASFRHYFSSTDATIIPALTGFVAELSHTFSTPCNSLLCCPSRGSACKRLFLFMRWMTRRDNIDPGGWDIPASHLVVPLDTHMHRIARALHLTARKQADLKTALEVTQAFKKINSFDPVRYDFALTRLGIRQDADFSAFINNYFINGAEHYD